MCRSLLILIWTPPFARSLAHSLIRYIFKYVAVQRALNKKRSTYFLFLGQSVFGKVVRVAGEEVPLQTELVRFDRVARDRHQAGTDDRIVDDTIVAESERIGFHIKYSEYVI